MSATTHHVAAPVTPPAFSISVAPPPMRGVSSSKRVIMHVDMDCFYAQVERERFPQFRSAGERKEVNLAATCNCVLTVNSLSNPFSSHKPLAVVQQGTFVVTSNYRCRARGMPKTWYLSPAIDQEMQTSTLPSFAHGAATSTVAAAAAAVASAPLPSSSSSSSSSAAFPCRPNYSGSSMSRYRSMCRRWMQSFESFEGGKVTLMRRGIDECLLDLTALAIERARKGIIKTHAEMTPSERAEQDANAAQRFATATAAYQSAESSLPPNERESAGRLAPAMKASLSKDPMTGKQGARLGGPGAFMKKDAAKMTSGNTSSAASSTTLSPAMAINTFTPAGLLSVTNDRPALAYPSHLQGKTEEEVEEFCNRLHPENYCRARKGEERATKLYTQAELTQHDITAEKKISYSPWIGHVFLSGWGDEAEMVAKSTSSTAGAESDEVTTTTKLRDVYEHKKGVYNMDMSAAYGLTVTKTESAAEANASLMAASSSSAAAAQPAAPSVTSSSPHFPTPTHLDWSSHDIVTPPSFAHYTAGTPVTDPSHDLLLAIGSQICFELRCALFRSTGLTTSACVAPNPMLAKLGSGLRKPNQQCVVRSNRDLIRSWLRPMKLRSVPGFGPVSQSKTNAHGIIHIGQLQNATPPSIITSIFGEKFGSELEEISEGVDHTIVKTLGPPKSVMQEKSKRVHTAEEFQLQVEWLIHELESRLKDHEEMWEKRAANLNVMWAEYDPNIKGSGGSWSSSAPSEPVPDSSAKAGSTTASSSSKVKAAKRKRGSRSINLSSSFLADPTNPCSALLVAARSIVTKYLASFPKGVPFTQMSSVGVGVTLWRDCAIDESGSEGGGGSSKKKLNSISSFLVRGGEASPQKMMKQSTPTTTPTRPLHPTTSAAAASASSSAATSSTSVPLPLPSPADAEDFDPFDMDTLDESDDILDMLNERDERLQHAAATTSSNNMQQYDSSPSPDVEMFPRSSMLGSAMVAAEPPTVAAPIVSTSSPPPTAASHHPCSVCGRMIESTPRAIAEHSDYHLALECQSAIRAADREQREAQLEQIQAQRVKSGGNSAAPSKAKARKSTGSASTSSSSSSSSARSATIQSFFQPKN